MGSQLPWLTAPHSSPHSAPEALEVVRGRALFPTAVYQRPAADASILRKVLPDTVIPLAAATDSLWYRTTDGFIPRESVQPMLLTAGGPMGQPAAPFWAEVTGPVAAVRAWCAPDAPLITRIGHGGVAQMIDYLPGDAPVVGWYGVAAPGLTASDGSVLGWTQSAPWAPTEVDVRAETISRLVIDRAARQITAYDRDQVRLRTAFASGGALPAGVYSVVRRAPGGVAADAAATYHGAAWPLIFDDARLSVAGAYWHNRFGSEAVGPAIQVAPAAARWLYRWIAEETPIHIA
ncbi:MAG: L,D-transpeptidase [Chloroflexi bacterium]|nr:L,D-transpeptidase [Chloroflexota bacterium]